MADWRETSSHLLEIGGCLATIEQNFRHVHATAVVTDQQARSYVEASYSAATKMVRALDRLRRSDALTNGDRDV